MKVLIPLLFLTLCSCSLLTPKKKSWDSFKTPTQGPTEALGSPSAGCLAGALHVEEKGDYILMRPTRERFWAHTELKDYIERSAKKVNENLKAPLLVGDMAQARGGRLPGSHVSHQHGLDVDLWYEILPSLPSDFSREDFSATSYVKKPELWTKSHAELVRLLASDEKVERIFVNAALKKNLCKSFKGEPWLRVVRPWWGHDDHLHVRLKCPESDKLCQNGPAIPQGDGCGKELEWWFSEEAKLPPATTPTSTEPIEPVDKTPAFCEPLRQAE